MLLLLSFVFFLFCSKAIKDAACKASWDMETFVAWISLWHEECWFMFVTLFIQSIIQQIDCCKI